MKNTIEEFLNMGICITEALGKLHQKNIVYKDKAKTNMAAQLKWINFF